MAAPEPLVSIAVPIWNTARFLPVALDSLLAQGYPSWEGLLWDDGSTDGSAGIAADYARRDPRFRLLGNGRQNGNAGAMALALANARGMLLGWLDSDDLLEPHALSSMVAFMQANPGLGMAYSQYLEIDEHGNPLGIGSRCRIPYSPHRLLLDFMVHHFHLIRADAYRKAGGYTDDFPTAADYDLTLRLSECCEIAQFPEPLYRYRLRRDAMSALARLSQARDSYAAARRALQRRGLDRHHALSLRLRVRHVLHPKTTEPDEA